MPLLDQFRRPDRGSSPPLDKKQRTGVPEEMPANSNVAVVEQCEQEEENKEHKKAAA